MQDLEIASLFSKKRKIPIQRYTGSFNKPPLTTSKFSLSRGGLLTPKIFSPSATGGLRPPDPPLVPTNPQIIFAKASLCFQPQNDVETFVTFDNRKY